ncbi:MAG TPA: glycosyltransferase, partial [Polyangiales bacterium]|nr:glycosyltransferase [Polyangiales bacterium]
MKIAIFGLTISSSWGNGHATLWRGLCRALAQLGHRTVFFEHEQPYYAQSRDDYEVPGGELVLYESWVDVKRRVASELHDADAAIVTSYCPDALRARDAITASGAISIFYDLDTPVTLMRMRCGEHVPYLDDSGLAGYDLVLSYTGGGALEELRTCLGAYRVRPLYGHVDPELHRPAESRPNYRADLSWLGTYAPDRQAQLEELFVEPARRAPKCRFLIGGAQYPADFPWARNVYFVRHVPPEQHSAFFSSSRLTLNVTREAMAQMGWCPSGRLFEAAACGAAILSDEWSGLDEFYEPGTEILLARNAEDTLAALDLDDATLRQIGRAARERTL